MTLLNLRNRNCVVCHVRGDSVKKEKVIEIKGLSMAEKLKDVFNLADLPSIGSIYCKKHYHQMKARDINNNYNQSTETLSEYNNNTINSTPSFSQDNNTDSTTTLSQINDENVNIDFNVSINDDDHDLSALNNKLNKNKFKNNSYLVVDLPKTYNSHKFCFICKKASGK